eukprot:1155302-Pelagomonas_calceolata.AAC.2
MELCVCHPMHICLPICSQHLHVWGPNSEDVCLACLPCMRMLACPAYPCLLALHIHMTRQVGAARTCAFKRASADPHHHVGSQVRAMTHASPLRH